MLGEELEHERTTYVPSEVVSRGPPQPFEIIESDGDCEVTLIRTYGEDEEIAITFNATEVRRATRSASAFDPTRARPPPPRDRIRRRDAVPPSTLNETRPSRPRSPLSQDPYDEDDGLLPVEGELEEDEEEDITIHFLVSVSKGDGREALEFSCATDGETVEVRNVRYESLGSDDEDDMGSYMSSYPGPNYDELDESVQEEFHKYLEARGVDSSLANYIMEVHIDKEQKEYTRWLENVGNFVRAK